MPSLKRMKKMSYAEAWEFFMKEERMGSREASDYLMYISHKSPVYDMRGISGIPEEIYKGGWLILLDGVSCSGKSTTAKKLAEKFPDTLEVVDIDYLLEDWLYQETAKISNKEEMVKFLRKYEKLTDEYLKLNLENIIASRAEDGKTIILAGCFLEFIYRALVGNTLGKYFEGVVFFTIYEEMNILSEYQKKREADFKNPGGEIPLGQIEETSRQFKFLEQVLKLQPSALGLGADISFLINSKTKLY